MKVTGTIGTHPTYTITFSGLTADELEVLEEIALADMRIPNLLTKEADLFGHGYEKHALGRRAAQLLRQLHNAVLAAQRA